MDADQEELQLRITPKNGWFRSGNVHASGCVLFPRGEYTSIA